MTAPRIPLFQRKGGPPSGGDSAPGKPSVVIAIGHGGGTGPKGQPPDDSGPDAGQGAKDDTPVQCPQCGCTFDPATGEPVDDQSAGQDGQGGPPMGGDAPSGDVSEKLKAMMGAASGGGGN